MPTCACVHCGQNFTGRWSLRARGAHSVHCDRRPADQDAPLPTRASKRPRNRTSHDPNGTSGFHDGTSDEVPVSNVPSDAPDAVSDSGYFSADSEDSDRSCLSTMSVDNRDGDDSGGASVPCNGTLHVRNGTLRCAVAQGMTMGHGKSSSMLVASVRK